MSENRQVQVEQLLRDFKPGTYIARVSGLSQKGNHYLLTLSVPSKGARQILYAYTNKVCNEVIARAVDRHQGDVYVEGTVVKSAKSGKAVLVDIANIYYGPFEFYGLTFTEEGVLLKMRIRALKRTFNLSSGLPTVEKCRQSLAEVKRTLFNDDVCYFMGNALFSTSKMSSEEKTQFLSELTTHITEYVEKYL